MPWKINFRYSFTFFALRTVECSSQKKNEKFTHFSARLHDMTSYLRARESLISPRRLYFFKIQLFSWFYLFIQCALPTPPLQSHHFSLLSNLCVRFKAEQKEAFRPSNGKTFRLNSVAWENPPSSDTTPHSTATSIFFFRFSTLCIFLLSFCFFTRGNEKSADSRARDTRENTTRIQPNSRTIPCKLMSAEFSTRVKCFVCGTSFSLSEKLSEFPSLTHVAFPREPTLVLACLNFNPNSIHWTDCAAGEDEGRGLFCVPSWYILFVRYILKSPPTQAHRLKICYVIYKADMYPTLKNKQGMKL